MLLMLNLLLFFGLTFMNGPHVQLGLRPQLHDNSAQRTKGNQERKEGGIRARLKQEPGQQHQLVQVMVEQDAV